ncbi:MAG: AAA family ATPase [Colwellia sp.]|nr:AAA family ATPase [Colwellia sp.]
MSHDQAHFDRYLKRLATEYPVVTVTGPRQSGKTRLYKTVFNNLLYVNLERPDLREFGPKIMECPC